MTRQEILAVSKPILFNTEMVRAILDNRKSCTRRVIKLKYSNTHLELRTGKYGTSLIEIQNEDETTHVKNSDGTTTHRLLAARKIEPRYHKGDLLYVRETFFREDCTPDCAGREDENECPFNRVGDACYGYKTQYIDSTGKMKWRSSIHMPKEAARIFLWVTDVRVARLQNMSQEDAVSEGFEDPSEEQFALLWDSTVKPADLPLYGWDANPWVWVYGFERVEVKNER